MLELAEPVDAALALVEALELVELELLEQAARATRIAVAVENAAARLLKRRLETGSILKIPSPETRLAVGLMTPIRRRLLKVTTRAFFVTNEAPWSPRPHRKLSYLYLTMIGIDNERTLGPMRIVTCSLL
jgi:hypothetical protein